MKKYIRVLLLAALVCSLLAGCSIETKSSKDSQDESKYHLYYLNESETVLREEPYSPGEETADFMVKDLMQKLGSKDAPDGEISLLPEDVSINSYEVQKDLLVIDFSKEYSKMSKIREVMTRDGVVQSFLQIPDIHKVQFTVGGQPLTNSRNQRTVWYRCIMPFFHRSLRKLFKHDTFFWKRSSIIYISGFFHQIFSIFIHKIQCKSIITIAFFVFSGILCKCI